MDVCFPFVNYLFVCVLQFKLDRVLYLGIYYFNVFKIFQKHPKNVLIHYPKFWKRKL